MKFNLVFGALFLVSLAFGSPVPKAEEANLIYGAWKVPSTISVGRLEQLIQKVSDKVYGKGFRYLGVPEDFDHGHILFEAVGTGAARRLYMRAILYHTQESAHAAHWENHVDPKYDYLNVTARNWIQWLSDDPGQDGSDIRNAREYLDETKPTNPADVLKRDPVQFFDETLPPRKEWHYTIHAQNLDSKKLGFDLVGELQVVFDEMSCATVPSDAFYAPKGPISVTLPSGPEVCLGLSTNTTFLSLPWGT